MFLNDILDFIRSTFYSISYKHCACFDHFIYVFKIYNISSDSIWKIQIYFEPTFNDQVEKTHCSFFINIEYIVNKKKSLIPNSLFNLYSSSNIFSAVLSCTRLPNKLWQ